MSAAASPRDLLRQITVLSATVFMLIAAMVGTGLFGGTAVQDLQGGALDEDGSFLAPAGPAFSIWSLVYLGLIAYAIWQALPAQRRNERQRVLGWGIALTEVLNGLWLVAAQFTTLPVTVLTIFLLLAALSVVFRRTVERPRGSILDAILVDGVTGLHLGWVTLASVANVSAWLTQIAPPEWVAGAEVWGLVVLVVVALVGSLLGWLSGGRLAPAAALAWGLSWVAVGRLGGEPQSTVLGVAAIVVAVLIVAVTVVSRLRRTP
ncbi:tryptophan-rich sensory protein [Microbacterium sp. cx-55]|uniref:tryptophan-rich sensory protein n=1 Tax=Microbacterium sp. cx-55 TaxID=2875948 RepID=UPI001CC08A08|nr:tryptophan-rich sensory protein [Microbacterium sp. cx-55]MBZ4487572.1 tryptophan-rich sensory protein [Microbacterium sp. cx-55]UGB35591.1 tryptophan-rich sensory protein [Microbacterium sp. cx-55]